MKRVKSIDKSIFPDLKLFVFTSLITAFVYAVLGVGFRHLRDLFPKPESTGEIIGFAQYFGYPLFFDNVLFWILIITPVAAYFILKSKLYEK